MSNTDKKPDETAAKVEAGEWLIRPCEVYSTEYKDCRSLKARFHQYYVFGEVSDCTQWKRDHDNCNKWIQNKDLKAAAELIDSERSRRRARLAPHYANNVWERRKKPPDDWNKPLPEHMQEEYEASYLNVKSREMKGESWPENQRSVCVIL